MKTSSRRARGVVGAVEDRDVVVGDVAAVGERVDLLGDEPGLVVLVVGDVADDQFALAGVGPQPLLAAARVAGDDGVGGRQDVLRRAVVLFQQNRRRVRVVALEVLDVADGGAAERVDRLVGVADDAQLAGRHAVGVLEVVARPVRAPARTGRGWCPGTRRPGCAGSAAGSTGRSAGRPAARRPSRRSGRRSPARWPPAAGAGTRRRPRRRCAPGRRRPRTPRRPPGRGRSARSSGWRCELASSRGEYRLVSSPMSLAIIISSRRESSAS